MEWFFYNLVILIKLHKICYVNLDKALLFSRNQAIFLKNWKLWRAPSTTKFNIFCWKFCTHFLHNNVYKRVCGLFFILLRSWVINKNIKNECEETRSFLIFANNSRSQQNKKNPEDPFVDIGKLETCATFQQKIMNSMVVGACQGFQFFRQKTWFLKDNRALSKFLYGILNYLISIIKS